MDAQDQLLQESVDTYRAMYALFQKLAGSLEGTEIRFLGDYLGCLRDLQQNVEDIDSRLNDSMRENKDCFLDRPLYQERIHLIETIMEHHRLLMPRLANMKAVLGAEISQIQGGRVAIGGYKVGLENRGRIVRGCF